MLHRKSLMIFFGHRLGDVFVEGLLDSENDSDFQEKVDNLMVRIALS